MDSLRHRNYARLLVARGTTSEPSTSSNNCCANSSQDAHTGTTSIRQVRGILLDVVNVSNQSHRVVTFSGSCDVLAGEVDLHRLVQLGVASRSLGLLQTELLACRNNLLAILEVGDVQAIDGEGTVGAGGPLFAPFTVSGFSSLSCAEAHR